MYVIIGSRNLKCLNNSPSICSSPSTLISHQLCQYSRCSLSADLLKDGEMNQDSQVVPETGCYVGQMENSVIKERFCKTICDDGKVVTE